MSKNEYEVIIVGAGPSGLSTALNLVKLGIKDILVIEQFKFPRYKCCAGYITNKTRKTYESLGLDFKQCHYSLIKDFNIFYKLKLKQKIANKFLYTNRKIDRVELDNAFFELAKSQKIKILENTKIIDHDIDTNTITVSENRILKYKHLVFADGTMGFSSKYQDRKKINTAMQMTFECTKKEEIQIHFGITKRGYGWVSTFDGITNVGLTDVYNSKINYREIYKKFLDDLKIDVELKNLKGAFTPIGIGKPIINNVFFVGDAVGACDPLTLSGLRYGLTTGEKCAKAIKENKKSIYKRYILILKIKFGFMKILLKIFYLKSTLFLIFNIGCKYLSRIISFIFNNFFINKK